MKRKLFVLLSLVLLFSLLTACSSPVAPDPSKASEAGTEESSTDSEPEKAEESSARTIKGYTDDGTTAKGLNVYDSFEYDISQDGISDKITLYTGAKQENGEWVFSEDGQQWALVAQVGAQSYDLFGKKYVSGGEVSYSVIKPKNGDSVHILVTCRDTKEIEINDFVYAEEGNAFSVTQVYSSGSISLIHGK